MGEDYPAHLQPHKAPQFGFYLPGTMTQPRNPSVTWRTRLCPRPVWQALGSVTRGIGVSPVACRAGTGPLDPSPALGAVMPSRPLQDTCVHAE